MGNVYSWILYHDSLTLGQGGLPFYMLCRPNDYVEGEFFLFCNSIFIRSIHGFLFSIFYSDLLNFSLVIVIFATNLNERAVLLWGWLTLLVTGES